jgi:hypothetical protein
MLIIMYCKSLACFRPNVADYRLATVGLLRAEWAEVCYPQPGALGSAEDQAIVRQKGALEHRRAGSHLSPSVGHSPDKMLQVRIFSYVNYAKTRLAIEPASRQYLMG